MPRVLGTSTSEANAASVDKFVRKRVRTSCALASKTNGETAMPEANVASVALVITHQ